MTLITTPSTAFARPAPLRNVGAFAALLEQVVERSPDLPGLAVFYGLSGLGKTKSAIYGANIYKAAYVECGQFTTARSLMVMILKELGVQQPRGSIPELIDQAVERMALDMRRPLIIDEAHHIAARRFVDLMRELHDKSLAPVVLIGEETLPRQLERFERVHNRILTWVQAVPCDRSDLDHLIRARCRTSLTPETAEAILRESRGNTRRIVVALARAEEIAGQAGVDAVTLDLWQAALAPAADLRRTA